MAIPADDVITADSITAAEMKQAFRDFLAVLRSHEAALAGGAPLTAAAIGTTVQAFSAALTSLAALTTAADKMPYTTALNTYAVTDLTAFARTILDDADAAAVRATLGLGTAATTAATAYATAAQGATADTALQPGAVGSTVQAYDAGLASIAGLTTAADKMVYTSALDTYAVTDLTAFGRTLIDDADAATARTTLGLGTAATTAATAYATAAQGATADTALQPSTAIDVASVTTTGNMGVGGAPNASYGLLSYTLPLAVIRTANDTSDTNTYTMARGSGAGNLAHIFTKGGGANDVTTVGVKIGSTTALTATATAVTAPAFVQGSSNVLDESDRTTSTSDVTAGRVLLAEHGVNLGGTQTIAGAKTFSSQIVGSAGAAITGAISATGNATFGGTTTGDLIIGGTQLFSSRATVYTEDPTRTALTAYANVALTEPLVQFWQDGATATGPAVFIRNDGTGDALRIDDGGGNVVFSVTGAGNTEVTGKLTANKEVANGTSVKTRVSEFLDSVAIIRNETGEQSGIFFSAAGGEGLACGIAGVRVDGGANWKKALDFYVNNITGGNTDDIQHAGRINPSGNWHIGGTTDPGVKLGVTGAISATAGATINVPNFNATTNPGILLRGYQSSNTATVPVVRIEGQWEKTYTANLLKVAAYDDAAGFNILHNGNVGINKAAPATALDVTGAISATGQIKSGVNAGSNAQLEVAADTGEVFRADAAGGAYRVVVNQAGVNLAGVVDVLGAISATTGVTVATGQDVLANYLEGTWTPVITGSSTAGTGTYTQQFGSYTRIGRVVFFEINITTTAHTGTGDIRISLPFSAASGTNGTGATGFMINVSFPAGGVSLSGQVLSGTANMGLFMSVDSTALGAVSDLVGTYTLHGFYRV